MPDTSCIGTDGVNQGACAIIIVGTGVWLKRRGGACAVLLEPLARNVLRKEAFDRPGQRKRPHPLSQQPLSLQIDERFDFDFCIAKG